MKLEDKIEYLKNELRSYNMMKKWIQNDSYVFDNRIAFYERKIKEIDIQLSSGNAKGIDYKYIPTSAVHEPLLTLLAEQEKYIKRCNELIELKRKDIYGFKARINYIEDCLNKLDDEWQRKFIIEYYCNDKGIDDLIYIVNRSRSQLFYDKDNLLLKMI